MTRAQQWSCGGPSPLGGVRPSVTASYASNSPPPLWFSATFVTWPIQQEGVFVPRAGRVIMMMRACVCDCHGDVCESST